MPYSNISQLPSYLKKYSEKVRRQWLYVFNTVFNKVLKETKNKNEAETRAFKAANSVLKKRFDKDRLLMKNTRGDFFSFLIDRMLENLK